MGKLAFVAVGALRRNGRGEEVVGAAGSGAALGVAALWIRHFEFPFKGMADARKHWAPAKI
jgi:hypothetical protein